MRRWNPIQIMINNSILLKLGILTASALCTNIAAIPSITAAPASNLSKDFQSPPDAVKPSGYWWWLNGNVDKEAITRDMEEFRAKGMGAVLLVSTGQWGGRMTAKGPAFLSDEWRELFKHALREADRVGIKVDVNLAPGWNMGGPWVTKDKACRWFLQSETTLKGPQKFSGKLPLPNPKDGYDSPPQFGVKDYIDLPIEEVDYRDNSVVAFRTPKGVPEGKRPARRADLPAKSNRLDANCFIPSEKVMSQTLGTWKSSPDDHPVNPKDVIDLTSKLKPDGSLDWDVPAGDWTIVRTGHRMTGAKLCVPMPGQGGLENDYLDRAGVELMFEKVGKVLIADAGPLVGKTLRGFVSDSFECGYPNWTDNMLKRFKHYRGYDPTPYLPVFRGWIVGSAEISDRFLHDYRKTVADCFADEHYGRFTELCRENGLMTRCESAGPSWSGTMCMDALKNLGRVDFPQGEFWRNEFIQKGQNMVGKQTASAAHIYGKRTVSAEAFTSGRGHWNGSPQNLKFFLDRAFCEGMNNCVFHTVTCQRPVDGKPGYEYGAGTHFNPNVTWWDQAAGPWISYINRSQAMLQSGLFVADALYYNGDSAPNLVDPSRTGAGLGKGYDFDFCNAEVLLTRTSVKDGRIVLPDGMSYQLLVLPESKRMPVEVIQKIEKLVSQGATIIGPRPESDPGLKNYPTSDATIRKIAAKLWGKTDGKKGVIDGKTPREVLQTMGIGPDVEVAGQPDTFIDFIHRVTPEADFYFLANRNDSADTATVTFRQTGRTPELWNPVDGSQRDLSQFTIKDGRTSVPLEFAPHGSMFIVFRKQIGKPVTQKPEGQNFTKLATTQEIKGPWTVRFDQEWLYPLDGLTGQEAQGVFKFKTLQDWTKHSVPAVQHFSGTAVYNTEFSVDQKLIKSGNPLWLNLGKVNISAAVKLNGTDLGVVWCSPWQTDVSKALKPGVNILTIEVVNLWPNRMIGDGKLPEAQRRTKSNITGYYRKPHNGGEHTLYPSGLIGPVTLRR